MIDGFELLVYIFLLGNLFNEPIKHFVSFFIDFGKISYEFTDCKKVNMNKCMVIFEV